jgi:glycosyltransferase involved in cell wall biosynthesis
MSNVQQDHHMKIGMMPVTNSSTGGQYQYSLTLLQALKSVAVNRSVTIFLDQPSPSLVEELQAVHWTITSLYPMERSFKQRVKSTVLSSAPSMLKNYLLLWRLGQQKRFYVKHLDNVIHRTDIETVLKNHQIKFVIYPAPTPLSFEAGVPYIMAIHDLQHLLQPEFPEVSANGEWQMREYVFRNGARFATMLLADSQVGKEDILNAYGSYGVKEDQVKVLPFLPPPYLERTVSPEERARVRTLYNLPERYLFYPAQFWPHKNHLRIVQALGILKHLHNLEIPVIFSGSRNNLIREKTYQELVTTAREQRIEFLIRYVGYLPAGDMSALYSEAAALVMPTFFGPTNIPVLEAWALGCPVITSNIRGIREQVGDAAALVDPRSSDSIAEGIYKIWTDREYRQTLITRGRIRLDSYTFNDYQRILGDILQEVEARVHFSHGQAY